MELSPDGHKHNCITSVTKPSFLTPSLTFLCQQMENYLMSGYVVRHNCGKFHHSVKDNRNENIVLFFFFQTCWHYINVLLTAAGFISVIFVCNASGTPEICSHTCSQSTQSSQRDPRGSVDAVSDTFRFLPFIFPPTQSPCTVAGECC